MADDVRAQPSGPRCPTCDRPVAWVGNPARPFCSRLCRLIDLGGWLDERHRVAGLPLASVATSDRPLDDE